MRKAILAAGVIALLSIGAVGVMQAEPIGGTGYDDVYYSDSTFTTAVGERYMQCGSGRSGWGVLSSYVETDEWDCQTGSPAGPACDFWVCQGQNQTYPGIYTNCSCFP